MLTDPDGVAGAAADATRIVTVRTRPEPVPAAGTAPGGRPRVKPGDTILVHAGLYDYRHELYGNNTVVNATTTFEGTYYLTADGTAEKPIVIKAAGDGEVIIDGRGNFTLFNVTAADYTYFEGLTFKNTQIFISAGTQFIAGACTAAPRVRPGVTR